MQLQSMREFPSLQITYSSDADLSTAVQAHIKVFPLCLTRIQFVAVSEFLALLLLRGVCCKCHLLNIHFILFDVNCICSDFS